MYSYTYVEIHIDKYLVKPTNKLRNLNAKNKHQCNAAASVATIYGGQSCQSRGRERISGRHQKCVKIRINITLEVTILAFFDLH